ncbi:MULTISPECIES: hypothetical protein [unclassified Microcoleus]|uniref:hypothetical protein n=1 Tax=unclassified Microcoleus TaxID=2642155 RepID=UPI002FD38B3F
MTIASLETKIADFESSNDVDSQENVALDKCLTYLKIKLKELLGESLNYERALEDLEAFNNTINLHVYHYQEKLSEISYKWQFSTDKLSAFNFFIERSCPYF